MSSNQRTISDILAVEYRNNQNDIFRKTREDKQLRFMQIFATPHKSHNCVDIGNYTPAKDYVTAPIGQ